MAINCLRLICAGLLLPVMLPAQDNSAAAGKKVADTPDARWAAVEAAAKPSSIDSRSLPRGSSQQKIVVATNADKSRATAASAKDFYTKNPSHPRATDARKIEALAELRGIKQGDTVQETKALAVAAAFRANPGYPQSARIEVALLMEQSELSRQIKAGTKQGRVGEQLRVADRLRAEFGETPEYYTYTMQMARTLDLPTALRFATEALHAPAATAATKLQAKTLVDRMGLLGKPIALRLTGLDGTGLDLAKASGKITLLLAWSPSDPSSLAVLKTLGKAVPKDAQIVYLALGGTEKAAKALWAAPPLPGVHCHAPAGPLSRAVSEALHLRYSPVPRVYVLNKAGNLAGFGPLEDLPLLLTRAAG